MSSVATTTSSRPVGAASMHAGSVLATMCALKGGKELAAMTRAATATASSLPPVPIDGQLHGTLVAVPPAQQQH